MAITALIGAAAGAGAVALGATILTAVAVGIGAAAVFDHVMDGMMPDDVSVDTMGGRTTSVKNSTESRKIVYGTVRTGGTIIYQENSGNSNEYLHNVIVLSEGIIGGIKEVYFDNELVASFIDGILHYHGKYTLDGSETPTTNSSSVDVRFSQGTISPLYARTGSGKITSNGWGLDHDLSGIAHAYVRLYYNDEVYTTGFPKITFLVEGKKHYDPRQDNTSDAYDADVGASNMRVDTDLVSQNNIWQYSNNPAICLLNYMMDSRIGLGESIDSFDLDSLVASINDCNTEIFGKPLFTSSGDFIVGQEYEIRQIGTESDDIDWASVGADASPSNEDRFIATADGSALNAGGSVKAVYKKYTCDGIIDSKNSHKANIQNILTSMNGQLLYSSGKYHIKSYKYDDPHSQVVTEDMIIGGIDIATKQSRRSLYNRVKGKFVCKEENYVLTEYPTQIYLEGENDVKQWEIDDGEVLYHEYNLPMTINEVTAQRLARLTLNRSRAQNTIKFTTNAKGLLYTVGDNIKFSNATIGYSEADPKIYQIQRLNIRAGFEKGLVVNIEARENSPDFYDWDEDTDLLDFNTGTNVNLYGGTVTTPTNLELETYYENDKSKLRVRWGRSEAQGYAVEYKVFYRLANSSSRLVQEAYTYDNFIIINVKDEYEGQNLQVFVQAVLATTGAVSGFLSGYIRAARVLNANPNYVVRGFLSNPTVHDVALLAAEAGVPVNEGREVTYLQLNVDGEVIASEEFMFESVSLTPITTVVKNDVVGQTFGEQLTNGTFSDQSGWIGKDDGSGDEFTISGGKLNYISGGAISFKTQILTGIAVGKKYTVTFNVDSIQGADPRFLFTVRDFQEIDDVLLNMVISDLGTGEHTQTFIARSDSLAVAFLSVVPLGMTATIDNVSIQREDEEAVHKIMLSLPKSVTADVTWTYSFEQDNQTQTLTNENSTGIVDVAGVTTELIGFDDSLIINNRKSVEIGLIRAYDSIGFSQMEVTVTADWTQEKVLEGKTFQVPKTTTETVVLSARVR